MCVYVYVHTWQVVMVDYDEEVCRACWKHLPGYAEVLQDTRHVPSVLYS